MPNVIDPNVRAGDFDPRLRRLKDFQPGRIDRALMAVATRSQALRAYTPGIDVSHWQGFIDWAAVKAGGYLWAGIKATESDWFVDDRFERNWQEAATAGVLVMPYHFFRSHKDGAAQAEHHLNTIRALIDAGIYLPSAGDFETNDGGTLVQRQTRAKAFLDFVAAAENKTPAIYSSKGLWASIYGSPTWASSFSGWAASWTPSILPTIPTNWTAEMLDYWQFGVAGQHYWCPASVPGVNGTCDVNRSYRTIEELRIKAGDTQPGNSTQVKIMWDYGVKKGWWG